MVAEIAELVRFDFVFLVFGIIHVALAGAESPRAFHHALFADEVGGLNGVGFVAGVRSERLTGNFVGARFTHDTSRALDPHLHRHCMVFNATFDSVENRWKALENYELLRARKFAENIYYHKFARHIRGLQPSRLWLRGWP